MTNGSTSYNARVIVPSGVEITYNGSPAGGETGVFGSFGSKTWSGTDSPIPPTSSLGPKVYYTVMTSKGPKQRWYRQRPQKRSRKRSPNSYSMTGQRTMAQPGVFTYFHTGGGKTVYTGAGMSAYIIVGYAASMPSPPGWGANDEIALIGKLREKSRGSDFNMAVFLGEGHQTLSLIANAATQIYRSYTALRRGDVVSAAKYLARPGSKYQPPVQTKRKSLGQKWLELQYGWLPLLGDMKSGAEALAHRLEVPFQQVQRVSKKISLSQAEIDSHNAAFTFSSAEIYTRRQIIATFSERETLPKFLGLSDPELVLWELTPASFVADWIAPFGDWMAARAFASGLSGSFVTSTKNCQNVSGLRWKQTDQGIGSGCEDYSRIITTFNREVHAVLEVPPPEVKPLAKVASWQHCANAIALMASALRLK